MRHAQFIFVCSSLQNTFQVVLASDGESSYAIIQYADMQWAQSDSRDGGGSGASSGASGSGNGIASESANSLYSRFVLIVLDHYCLLMYVFSFYSETFAQAGLVNGSSSYYILPGSKTEDIVLLNSTSNIGQQGVWLFRTSNFLPASKCFTPN